MGFVEKAWEENQIRGSGAYVLKEKLKNLKVKLKDCNKDVFGDLRSRRNDVVHKMNELDKKELKKKKGCPWRRQMNERCYLASFGQF